MVLTYHSTRAGPGHPRAPGLAFHRVSAAQVPPAAGEPSGRQGRNAAGIRPAPAHGACSRRPGRPASSRVDAPQPMAFAELSITSNFSFLTGGSHPQEYALRAIELGLPAFAIADRNSVAGLVRAHQALKEAARAGGSVPRLLPAARLVLADGLEITALARNRAGWARLCRLLTLGAGRAKKGECLLRLDDLTGLGDLHLLLHPPAGQRDLRPWLPQARAFAAAHPHAHLVASPRYDGQDRGAHRPRRPRRRRARPAARRLGRADHAPRQPPAARRRADLHPRRGCASTRSAAPRSPTPSAGCARRPRCCGCSRATPPRCTAPARSPTTAASRSTSCATSTRRRSGTARTRRRGSSG